jgi:hypothetical protein
VDGADRVDGLERRERRPAGRRGHQRDEPVQVPGLPELAELVSAAAASGQVAVNMSPDVWLELLVEHRRDQWGELRAAGRPTLSRDALVRLPKRGSCPVEERCRRTDVESEELADLGVAELLVLAEGEGGALVVRQREERAQHVAALLSPHKSCERLLGVLLGKLLGQVVQRGAATVPLAPELSERHVRDDLQQPRTEPGRLTRSGGAAARGTHRQDERLLDGIRRVFRTTDEPEGKVEGRLTMRVK